MSTDSAYLDSDSHVFHHHLRAWFFDLTVPQQNPLISTGIQTIGDDLGSVMGGCGLDPRGATNVCMIMETFVLHLECGTMELVVSDTHDPGNSSVRSGLCRYMNVMFIYFSLGKSRVFPNKINSRILLLGII